MRALITGISGFAGSFLAQHLLEKNYELSGTFISEDVKNIDNIKEEIKLEKIDLLSRHEVNKFIEKVSADFVFHLAALTSPKESFESPEKIFTNNVTAQINILEAIRLSNTNPRILITSSAEVYGLASSKDLPIGEATELKPSSPYAVSKIAQDYLALQYFLSYDMDIVRVRPFNHIGPRQSPNFVISSFAKQIADIEKRGGSIKVGNLDSKRDFTDVRDMVRAYLLLLEKGKSGEVYNAGSGKSHRIGNILDKLISYSVKKIKIETEPSRLRPSDTPDIYSDNSKIEKETGWKAQIPLEKTLLDTLNYWRERTEA